MAKKLKSVNSDTTEMVTKKTIRDFVADADTIASKTTKLGGDKSALFTRAEKAGVNKQALKTIISINNMEDGTRGDFLAAFDLYRGYLGLDDYDQGNMFDASNEKKVTPEAKSKVA